MSEIKKGDVVRLVVEGEVTRVWADDYPEDAGLDIDGETFDGTQVGKGTVEKIEPPAEVFKRGDIVRYKKIPEYTYLITDDGYVEMCKPIRGLHKPGRTDTFTSADFEKVELS